MSFNRYQIAVGHPYVASIEVTAMAKRSDRALRTHLHGNSKAWKAGSPKGNKQKHAPSKSSDPKRQVVRKTEREIDLHELTLHEAKEVVKKACRKATFEETLTFCHGFNHGTKIRDFIRDGPLHQSLASQDIQATIWAKDNGNTHFNRESEE